MAQKAQVSLLNGAHNASDALEKEAKKRKEELKKKEIAKPKDDPKKKALKPIQVKSLKLPKKTRNSRLPIQRRRFFRGRAQRRNFLKTLFVQ